MKKTILWKVTRGLCGKLLRRLKIAVNMARIWLCCRAYDCLFVFVSPGHTNLGDNAQTFCIRELLRKHYPGHKIIFITNSQILESKFGIIGFVKRVAKKTDRVFLHSGYRMTEVWEKSNSMHLAVVRSFNDRRIVSFPQTINYTTQKGLEDAQTVFNAHPDNVLLCRDEVSFAFAQKHFYKCTTHLMPDVVTMLIGRYQFHEKRSGILLCKRNDSESLCRGGAYDSLVEALNEISRVNIRDTYAACSWRKLQSDLQGYLETVWREFSRYKVVVTDRYHGTIFSLIASTPVVVIPSADHKLSTGAKWFSEEYPEYVHYVEDVRDVPRIVREIIRGDSPHSISGNFYEKYYRSLDENWSDIID